jgi:hypothetical protein
MTWWPSPGATTTLCPADLTGPHGRRVLENQSGPTPLADLRGTDGAHGISMYGLLVSAILVIWIPLHLMRWIFKQRLRQD